MLKLEERRPFVFSAGDHLGPLVYYDVQSVASFKLLDGTKIPWIGWGNGTGQAQKDAVECGRLALESGIHHIDTTQVYHNEKETGEAIRQSSLNRDDVYVTSKRMFHSYYLSNAQRCPVSTPDDGNPIALKEVADSVQASVARLGFVPDLFLIVR